MACSSRPPRGVEVAGDNGGAPPPHGQHSHQTPLIPLGNVLVESMIKMDLFEHEVILQWCLQVPYDLWRGAPITIVMSLDARRCGSGAYVWQTNDLQAQ